MMKLSLTFVIGGLFLGGRFASADDNCYTVDSNDYRWAGLFNKAAPWPPQCTGCSTVGEDKCNDYPCWCIPEGGNTGCCPDPGDRPLAYEYQVAEAFMRNVETSDPIVLNPPGCNPWPENQGLYPNLTLCTEFPSADDPNTVCAFMYDDANDEDCGGLDARNYKLQTFASFAAAEAAGGVVTHHGACGVCSNAHDLGVMMDNRNLFEQASDICASSHVSDDVAAASSRSVAEGMTYQCYKDLGLSDQCALIHASTDIAARSCDLSCQVDAANDAPGTIPDTCELSSCASCQQSFRVQNGVDMHRKWAGRDLWTSGLVSYSPFYHQKRSCAEWQTDNQVIQQDPYAKGEMGDAPKPTMQSADRFEPSYTVFLHDETCNYEVRFSMKHDESLPIAGGWVDVYPGGEDRQEFFRLCNRDSQETATDGLPYRQPREFKFEFGDDVKELTGFDHLAIVYNPCGTHNADYFGRAHYDLRLFTVSEEWRSIMECDVTPCDPSICVFDDTFQSSDSGKAFFTTDTCDEPFPPNATVGDVKPGAFGKNMPLGFFTYADMATPHSGVTSMNLFTELEWNETQVEVWTEPIFTMRSFDGLITAYEAKVPTEFMQGASENSGTNPESPSLSCQSLIGVPLYSNVEYTPMSTGENGFTTFSFSGVSPKCSCQPENPRKISADVCEANDAELAKYDAVYERLTGDAPGEDVEDDSPFGNFTVAEVEAAFGLEEGSLILPGSDEFDCLSGNNFWTTYVGVPLTQEKVDVPIGAETPRNGQFAQLGTVSTPLFTYEKDKYREHFLLGCFYRPKPQEILDQLSNFGASQCTNERTAFTGASLQYHVVAYVDEYTRLLFNGYSASYANDAQVMTQFMMATILPEYDLNFGEVFAVELKGPNAGDFSDFKEPEGIAETDFLGNVGQLIITHSIPDLTQPCPDSVCGSIVPGFISNPAAPNAPWPEKILENQCDWFPCGNLPGCTRDESICGTFEADKCAAAESPTSPPVVEPSGDDNDPTDAPSGSSSVRGVSLLLLLVGFLAMSVMV